MALGWVWWRLVAVGRRWSPLVARGAGALCGQAWHLATSTCVWRGRRGACGTGLALVTRLVAVSREGRRSTLRGRRGTCSHPPSFCVAGDIYLRLAWHAWHLWHWAGSGSALCYFVTSAFQLRGRRIRTWAHPPWLRVAGMALMALGSALSHVTLSHTTPSHATLSHTTVSQKTLSQTTLSHTQSLTHTHTTLSYVQLWHIELFHTRTHDSFVFPSALVLCFLSVHIGSLTSKLPLIRKHKNPPLRLFSVQPLTKLLALSQI